MLNITCFNLGPKFFNFEQRLVQKLLYFNITNYIKELMFLGFEYSFYFPLILTLESTKGFFFTSPLLRYNELLKLNYNIKEYNISYSIQKNINSYIPFLNLINSFNNINAFSSSLHLMANTGAKGVLDTALKTADAGYLTRRLVESIQELNIKEYNCGSKNSLEYEFQINSKGTLILPFFLLLSGKVLQKNLIEPTTKKIIEFKNNYISDNLINNLYIKFNSLLKINTFSIKTCISGRTICSKCFGHTTFNTNNLGKSIGILSSQVIGEPGTQLTLRTFHTGGASTILKSNIYIKNKYLLIKINTISLNKIYEHNTAILLPNNIITSGNYSINILLLKLFSYNLNFYKQDHSITMSHIFIFNLIIESLLKQYFKNGINIPSIQFELIAKKMTSFVKINYIGDSSLLENDIFEYTKLKILNYTLFTLGYKQILYIPIILGITKSILACSGFFLSISFQEIIKYLIKLSIEVSTDWLSDLKSNIITTDIIKTGSGWQRHFIKI
ncbi:DNA-directed RNA polymerase subunit beta''-like [Cyclospora cayetanensis]|uniref:DNA-directed RNA polymerase n=1 Tax=Cyclospora cayetanensis TaxID=88456 RepID=A0A6P6RPT0_9EIME|nr:DNA-directed RNA polymerase subunit beta''-like [Cyclospora cayetanensis]